MSGLSFQCFKCNQVSGLHLTAESRDKVHRINADPSVSKEVTFYCDRCGAANAITLTAEMISRMLERLFSDDPQIQKAIDDAKRGDFSSAIDQARRRFGF